MALTAGTRLGPYEIVSAIGAGGMGEVYKATDTRLSRTIAIKVLPPHWVADAEMKQRFEREAQTVASLKHPNICVLHDIGSENGVDFLVMEFLDGETLAERIKRGPLPLDEALEVAIAVTDALDKAHRQDVVHRDLKPSNVMLTQSGPKLLDFGLAKTQAGDAALKGGAAAAAAGRSGLTMPGMLIGTLQYMAPEQLEGGDADARTDIFALGVLLHEMVTGGVFKVPADGGTPELITALDASESGHFWPHFLPDGQHYLYTSWGQPGARAIYVGTLGSKDKKRVLDAESNAAYVSPSTGSGQAGYLLFHREKVVYAQAFDAKALTLSGEPARLADDVTYDGSNGRGYFSPALDGALAYFQNATAAAGGSAQADLSEWHLAWVGRTGSLIDTPGPPGIYRGVEVSPVDSKRVAVHKHEKTGGDIWIVEPTGAETRLTWDASQHNASPIWSPDGRSIVFGSTRNGKVGIYQKLADGSGADELLFESDLPKAPMSWSPDNKFIVFGVQDPKTGADLWLLALADKKAVPFIATPHTETHAQISPDGKWIAYSSDSVGGRREIHIQGFPSGAGHWQPSDAGGDWPRWRKDGKELFFHAIGPFGSPAVATVASPYSVLYSVTVTVNGAAFVPGAPAEVLNFRALGFPHPGGDYHTYAVSPDGQQFLLFQLMQATATTATTAAAIGPDLTAGLMVAMHWSGGVKK